MSPSENKPTNGLQCWFGFAFLGAAAFLLFSIISSHLRPAIGRFGDAAMGRAYATIICSFLIPAMVGVGQLLVCIGTPSRKLRLPGWVLAGMTSLALLVLVSSAIYSMRPLPTYDPQDYQHLVGRHLSDARAELDTRHSVSGASTSYRVLSFRGMKLFATPDGIITEVKKGYRD